MGLQKVGHDGAQQQGTIYDRGQGPRPKVNRLTVFLSFSFLLSH